jgi:hypothetical protein
MTFYETGGPVMNAQRKPQEAVMFCTVNERYYGR